MREDILLPHQKSDGRLMAAQQDLPNWSKPGTGKTLTTLTAHAYAGHTVGVVICPPIALHMWAETIKSFLSVGATVLSSGSTRPTGEERFLVTTYALAASSQKSKIVDWLEQFNPSEKRSLIFDEAHYLRIRTTKRTQAMLGRDCDGRGGIMSLFDQVWQLTGTPIVRWSDDLWAQLRPIRGADLRKYNALSYEQFVQQFCWTDVKKYHARMRPQRVIVGSKNEGQLRKLMDGIGAPRRTLQDMPPLTTGELVVSNPEIRKLVNKAKAMNADNIANSLTDGDEMVVKQWRELSNAKVQETTPYLVDSAVDGPILVGHWFRDVGEKLMKAGASAGLRVAEVNGSTSSKKREEIRKRFNAGEIDWLVGQMDAMQVSWNLQEAGSHIVIIDDHWSPSVVEQFYSRVYRMGQAKHCRLVFIKTEHPIDKALTGVRQRKTENVAKLLD